MRILATIAAALVLLGSARAAGSEDTGQLLRRLDASTPQAREQSARTLAVLGPGALAEFFALVSSSADLPQDLLLARAIALQPRSELQAFLTRFTRSELATERFKAALLVLREAGTVRELVRCLELSLPAEGDEPAELIATLAAICAREPAACDLAAVTARSAQPPEAEALVRGLAAARSGESARALVRLAQERPLLATLGFSCLLAEAEKLARPLDPELLAALREQLAREDHPSAPELLLLAGRLEDDESVPLLLERLGSARPELRTNALWSLRRITGLGLGPDVQAWSTWFREEHTWWKERAQATLNFLRSADPLAQRRALGELGQRFWHRQLLTSELADYLSRAQGEGARIACGLLARLGGPAALPALQARVEDPDPALQASARAAIASLTGKKIPSRSVALSVR